MKGMSVEAVKNHHDDGHGSSLSEMIGSAHNFRRYPNITLVKKMNPCGQIQSECEGVVYRGRPTSEEHAGIKDKLGID